MANSKFFVVLGESAVAEFDSRPEYADLQALAKEHDVSVARLRIMSSASYAAFADRQAKITELYSAGVNAASADLDAILDAYSATESLHKQGLQAARNAIRTFETAQGDERREILGATLSGITKSDRFMRVVDGKPVARWSALRAILGAGTTGSMSWGRLKWVLGIWAYYQATGRIPSNGKLDLGV